MGVLEAGISTSGKFPNGDESVSFQFEGLSLSFVIQHLKLRKYVRHFFKSQSGFTLPEVLIVVALGSVLLLWMSDLSAKSINMELSVRQKFWVEVMKTELIDTIRDSAAWRRTIQHANNGSMSCLRDGTSCNPLVNQGLIDLRSSDDVSVFNSTNPAAGFDQSGNLCNMFDAVNGNGACPFRFEISWAPACSGANCVNPEVRISIVLRHRPQSGAIVLNTRTHAFVFYRNPVFDSIQDNCESVGGVFDAATAACNWTRVASTCASQNRIFVGFDSRGNLICESHRAQRCPAGQWMKGFDNSGGLICETN